MAAPPPPSGEPGARAARALRWLLWLYVAMALVVAVQRTVLARENNFFIFRAAFEHLVAGEDLYRAYPALHADTFKYSPTFALLFAPFALLPATAGYALWALTCALSLFAGLARLLPAPRAAVALALAALSVVGDLQRAQSNVLCAGLMILAWDAFERRRQLGAATAIATGTLVKLFPLATLPAAIFHPNRARFGATLIGILAVGAALPLLVTAPETLAMQYRSWFAVEAADAGLNLEIGRGGADLYAGVIGLIQVWGGVRWPSWPTQLTGMAILLLPLARGPAAWSRRFRVGFLASVLVFCVLFNHQAESPSYAIAMVGAALWYASSERTWWRTALVAACIVVVNLGSTDLMPREWYRAYYVPLLLKTVPLVPLWLVMQGELLGVIANGDSSDRGESDKVERPAQHPVAHQG